ncbi:MAG: (5-formylfuran-3-yl)methyl phosphate synthase, partial [Planctomycetota bacterium]
MTNSTLGSVLDRLTTAGVSGGGPRLLVSVRDAEEALAALAGGASVIDVTEPAGGPLGPARPETVEAIFKAIAGRVPVTAALGELADAPPQVGEVRGLSAVKVGLAGLKEADWQDRLVAFQDAIGAVIRLVPVAYADSSNARSPEVADAMRFAIDRELPWIVVDTWDKSGGDLLTSRSIDEVAAWIRTADAGGMNVVLAGSLRDEAFADVASLRPTLVGVRGAACRGGRGG